MKDNQYTSQMREITLEELETIKRRQVLSIKLIYKYLKE